MEITASIMTKCLPLCLGHRSSAPLLYITRPGAIRSEPFLLHHDGALWDPCHQQYGHNDSNQANITLDLGDPRLDDIAKYDGFWKKIGKRQFTYIQDVHKIYTVHSTGLRYGHPREDTRTTVRDYGAALKIRYRI